MQAILRLCLGVQSRSLATTIKVTRAMVRQLDPKYSEGDLPFRNNRIATLIAMKLLTKVHERLGTTCRFFLPTPDVLLYGASPLLR